MSTPQMVGAVIGAIIIVAVLWNLLRRGAPSDRDEDTEGTFWSGD